MGSCLPQGAVCEALHPASLVNNRVFTGNRPSLSVMLPELNAYTVGQLLALYEHQVAVQVRVLTRVVCVCACARARACVFVCVCVCESSSVLQPRDAEM